MKKSLLLSLVSLIIFSTTINCAGSNNDNKETPKEIYVASWNLENLFDTIDDVDKNDEWFLPESEIEWTEERLEGKLNNLAKVIEQMNEGNGPDILGVQEVEHEALLSRLLRKLNLEKNYKIAYVESPDKRGIDNGLLYNSDIFTLENTEALTVTLKSGKITRDILHCNLSTENYDLDVFVNHWPSRREGLKKSEPNRIQAAETLMKKVNSLSKSSEANIIVLGDFNDLPSNISISKVLGAEEIDCAKTHSNEFNFVNITTKEFKLGKGTYRYRDHWNMLDQIIISNSLLDKENIDYKCDSFEIIKPQFLIQKEGKYKGTSLPTYGGRKYLGGFSDHFSIGAKFIFVN